MRFRLDGLPARSALCVLLYCTTPGACLAVEGKASGDEDATTAETASFQQVQAARLLRAGSRDELVASALIAFAPGGVAKASSVGDSAAAARLSKKYGSDVLAAYVLALLCHRQASCAHPEYRAHLLELDPDNAIHWLMVPSGGELTDEDLQRASSSKFADTHFSPMLGIVRQSLEGEDLALRRNEIGRVPWPNYGAVTAVCNAEAAQSADSLSRKRECAALGALLFGDRGSNMASKSVGSTLVRRFAKGSPQSEHAFAFRRQYVWMSEQLRGDKPAEEQERLNEEEIRLGEWEAYQRSAERVGVLRAPPPNWIPERPEQLLLQEER